MIEIKNRYTCEVLHTVHANTLRGAYLTEANLTEADLRGADLHGADLTEANLTGAHLTEANLRWADLTEANLTGAHLTGANLRWADLTEADLRRADLSGVDLTGADLRGAILVECLGVKYASVTWPGHGELGRQLLCVNGVYFCGCFRGTRDELLSVIKNGEEQHRASRTLTLDVVQMLMAAQGES